MDNVAMNLSESLGSGLESGLQNALGERFKVRISLLGKHCERMTKKIFFTAIIFSTCGFSVRHTKFNLTKRNFDTPRKRIVKTKLPIFP